MFNFIKKLFKKEEIINVSFEFNIEQISEHIVKREKNIINSVNENLLPRFAGVKETVDILSRQVDDFENAEIKDADKVEERVKLIVQGNRENYIKMLRKLIKELSISEDSEVSYLTAIEFCRKAVNELNEIGKNTQKSFYTSQHLFADNVEAIAKTLSELDGKVKEMISFMNERKILKVVGLKEKLEDFKKIIQRKTDITQQIEEEKKKIENIEKSKEDINDRIDELDFSEHAKGIKNLQGELESLKIELEAVKGNILGLFSPLCAAFKKYSKISFDNEKLLESYAEDTLNAFLNDKELRILEVLEPMKNSIVADALELKEEKKDKAIETIGRINKTLLNGMITKYYDLDSSIKILESKIKNHAYTLARKELDYKIEHLDFLLNKHRKLLEDAEKANEKINIDELKAKFESELKDALNENIKVII